MLVTIPQSLAVSILMQQGFTTLAVQKDEAMNGGTLLYGGAKLYFDPSQSRWSISGYAADGSDVTRYVPDMRGK